MLRRVRAAARDGRWLQSWTLLIGLSALYLVTMIVVAVIAIATINPDQGDAGGFAALAFTLLVGVAFVTFLLALVFGYLLRRDVAKPVVSVAVILGGLFVYWSSGWFELFLPVFFIGGVSGVLGLYEVFSRDEGTLI